MILLLANLYSRTIAGFFLAIFYFSLIVPVWASAGSNSPAAFRTYPGRSLSETAVERKTTNPAKKINNFSSVHLNKQSGAELKKLELRKDQRVSIGGPGQPEMSSFKSVGTDNMVNLFTGDFNYNIPLLDVGGYPVNIFYSGGITPEQEASWVGLGWNLNPGNINRNMRGIPDDFNGKDTLKQMQKMRPNKTWGLGLGADFEVMGVKNLVDLGVGGGMGIAFNNYLGPSLDLSLRGNASLKIAQVSGSEKTVNPVSVGAGFNGGVNINSRSGTSYSGGLSLTGRSHLQDGMTSFGMGLSTGYNSRSGLKALQISEQVSLNSQEIKNKKGELSGNGSISQSLFSTSISFAKPSYIPSLRMPVTNTAWSGHFQAGTGAYGLAADFEVEVYGQKSEITNEDTLQQKPMVGYLYYQNAINHPDYVMDFTRFNDREVTPNTQVISVPQYSYDVFTIQGEGTGGSIRAYRGDLGYVRDNTTTSKDKNLSIGADIDPPGHYGANVNSIKTPSSIGEWGSGNKLRNTLQFQKAKGTFEHVYFRNPGESSVLNPGQLQKIGGTDLVRFVLGGSNNSPTIEPKLQAFNALGLAKPGFLTLTQPSLTDPRNKRSQVINFLTAEEASIVGLDKVIKSYDNQQFLDDATNTLIYESIARYEPTTGANGNYRKAHHISQINVTEGNGRRYVYGIPVYNLIQQDFTFSVDNSYTDIPDMVAVNDNSRMTSRSSLLNDKANRDGYVQVSTTPAYAHSFLLSGILSPDYVDLTNDGITEDDLGNAVKFNYTQIKDGTKTGHKWRTPLSSTNEANFNPGTRSEVKDDKGIISYGERESWYLQSVESKNMIALFYVSDRLDGKGALSIYGGKDANEHFVKRLDSISLYSKADLKVNGLADAKPIKTVHFTYRYLLCQNTPDNVSGTAGNKGKLTLESIYFTYNGKNRAKKNKYIFSYSSSAGAPSDQDNPNYSFFASDRWGNYKPKNMNPGGLKNADYPYSIQNVAQKNLIDENAAAWTLKKIVVPSGGQIEVNYESDDYAYVQNRRATDMMQITGFGNSDNPALASNGLYTLAGKTIIEHNYVFISVPIACSTKAEIKERYLQGIEQLAFKIWVQMPKGPEYLPCYATYKDYGTVAGNANMIWIKLDYVDNKSPLTITALEYLRQQLPGQAYRGYDVSNETAFKQIADMLQAMLVSLKYSLTNPADAFRYEGKAMRTDLTKCFVRLNDPDGYKYGGGYRVKSVTLKDNWNAMTRQFTSIYGQKYDYRTSESFNGGIRTISSGVASYEPSIGGEENPFQTMIRVEDRVPLGPTSYGAVEMPVLDAFFPAPLVGYSKITVSSIKSDSLPTAKKSRSGIGKQVTEFYTAKDYPVYYSYTPFDNGSVKEFHQGSTKAFFNKYAYDYKAQSQGFLVATNDMHGKMKSQSSYADNDSLTRISYMENFYRNTGTNGINETFSFVGKENGGAVIQGNMGIDVELMTDTREFSVKGGSLEIQGQIDIFFFILANFPIPSIWPVSGTCENVYRSVTTTKVVNYHSVLDSVLVIDKGSQVSTKNLVYDAETGEVLITRTNNEFNQAIYNTSYPAYWAYGGMGLAYKNIDAVYTGVTFSDGKITTTGFDQSVFESGDEVYILSQSAPNPASCDGKRTFGDRELIWAYDQNKHFTGATGGQPDPSTPSFIFLDADGKPFTNNNVSIRIVRSGKRNMLNQKVQSITAMVNPVIDGFLKIGPGSQVIDASAVEFKEKWQTDNDIINKVFTSNENCSFVEQVGCYGDHLEKNINPYRKGLVGDFRACRNMIFYGDRVEKDPHAATKLAQDGFLSAFNPYWDFRTNQPNTETRFITDPADNHWVWNSQTVFFNAKGQEMETKNPLGVYTSAHYGYYKTTPIAITNNARYNEMFFDGLEDIAYSADLSGSARSCASNRHIDLTNVGSVINTDGENFEAHSGKYVLGISPGTSTVSLTAQTSIAEDFSTQLTQEQRPIGLVDIGGKIISTTALENTNSADVIYNTALAMNKGMDLRINPVGINYPTITNVSCHGSSEPRKSITGGYSIQESHCFEIPHAGYYFFKVGINQASSDYTHSPCTWSNNVMDGANVKINAKWHREDPICSEDWAKWDEDVTMDFTISNQNGQPMNTGWQGENILNTLNEAILVVCFPEKGIYKLNSTNTVRYSVTKAPMNDVSIWEIPKQRFTISLAPGAGGLFSSNFLTIYKEFDTQTTCLFTIPLKGEGNMLNPTFSLPASKKMVFSAWMRQDCGAAACSNKVTLDFGGGSTPLEFTPSGPVIEGWQRIEGVFTVPGGATSATLGFINNNRQMIYFDDIRMHPFNANMKSYVHDPVNLRLVAEQDANNYSTFYEYDEEGTLIRVKAETKEGIKTIKETRSSLQKLIQGVQ